MQEGAISIESLQRWLKAYSVRWMGTTTIIFSVIFGAAAYLVPEGWYPYVLLILGFFVGTGTSALLTAARIRVLVLEIMRIAPTGASYLLTDFIPRDAFTIDVSQHYATPLGED